MSNICIYNGKTYFKVDREAKEGDLIIIENHIAKKYEGKIFKVKSIVSSGLVEVYSYYPCPKFNTDEYKVLELMDDNGFLTKAAQFIQKIEELNNIALYLIEYIKPHKEEIIEQAKQDTKDLLKQNHIIDTRDFWIAPSDKIMDRAEFIVNENKRTVVCLIKRGNKVISRGIAKCHPNDEFIVDIGQAIALRRALQLEVPEEYLNLPKE